MARKVPQETHGPKMAKKVSVYQGHLPKLTLKEADIYHLWAEEFQTPLQIALRRGTSERTVRRHIQNIKSKGYVLNMSPGVPKIDPYSDVYINEKSKKRPSFPVEVGEKIRLHGQHFVVRLLHKTPNYEDARRRANVIYVQDCTVKLHRESIEVIASSGLSFFGGSADKATAESMEFWTRVLHRLEGQLGVVLLKPRAENIRQVGAHYARMNCGMAQQALDAGDRVRIYAREDGKCWFTIDNSFNLSESETIHPETAQRDMADVVEPHLNDWRAHPDLLPQSELQRLLGEVARAQAEVQEQLKTMVLAQVATQQQVQILVQTLQAVLPRRVEEERPESLPEGRPPYVG